MCGIVGIYNHPEAAKIAYLGLYALQHRGQESAGIVSSDGSSLYRSNQMGLVSDVFSEESFQRLPGNSAIGHVRYSTTGSSELKNCQPFLVNYARGAIAVSHNGNLVNAASLKAEFEAHGSIFQSTIDTEIIVHLLAASRKNDLVDRLTDALSKVKGAYSLLFITETRLIAVRDPHGFRPLVLGNLNGSPIFASETCALDLVEAKFVRNVEPGEIIIVDQQGLHSYKPFQEQAQKARCIFEYVYFARPDSTMDGLNVYETRKNFGRELARENPVDADIVVPVPDSGVPAAIGYAEESGIPFQMGLIRNHYVGRTFIEPSESIRHFGVKIKLNAIRELINGKRVILVDDSIVRGTTSRKIIKMLRAAGAKEIHFRISSPPTKWPCFYGIDTPNRKELIAATHSPEEIARYITCDSLAYLAVENLYYFQNRQSQGFCDACFTGKFPVALEDTYQKKSAI